MPDIKNLWPEELLKGDNSILPVTILQEQARFLNEMTKNIVIANVTTQKIAIAQNDSNDSKPGILHTLKIIAPAIGNYDFELARLIQEQLFPYPLNVYAPLTEQRFEATNSAELENILSTIFNDKKTIGTIQSIILQSK